METNDQTYDTLRDIKNMMEKSSRFISLSGWSGVAAGTCALAGAWFTARELECWKTGECVTLQPYDSSADMEISLITIALVTFFAAFILAFLFTWLRSKKTGVPVWGFTARKVMVNVAIPMLVGGILIWKLVGIGLFGLVAPLSLIFYGLGLVNASKYTLPEIRYLGYCQLGLGLVNLWMIGYGLYFWALGFGILHILYGMLMWWKYERVS